MNTDFLLEKRLAATRPDLSQNFKLVVFTMDSVLKKTTSLYPEFTDHTIRHSLLVLEMANQIIGPDQVERLNADEIYILLCAVYMHDFGMTISRKEYEQMKEGIVPAHFEEDHPELEIYDIVRLYHHLFSEKMIYKYAGIFEFPSEEYTYCIAKVAKGHRKVSLFDQKEYDPKYKLPNGNIVRLPYLAAIMRLCDEMDITIERNAMVSYTEHADVLSYQEHFAIKQLIIAEDRFIIWVETGQPAIREACNHIIEKLNETLRYCIDVTEVRTDFEIRQKSAEVFMNDLSSKTAIILDSDIGTDDAMALSLIRDMGDFKPDFIIATPGNASASQAVKNAVALKKMFGFKAAVVKGEAPEDIKKMAEKNTFHGPDGLAGISGQILEKYKACGQDFVDCLTMEDLKKELKDYDAILYIAICPLNSFCSLYHESNLKDKFTRVYIMGGGLRAFNCMHQTEFNFSKAPQAVKEMLTSGLDITLFPLDLTNQQQLSASEIDEMAENHADPGCITFLRYNLSANESYNGIHGAVLHDVMPMLYLCAPEKFIVEEKRLISDEYGAIREDDAGSAVKVAVSVEEGLMKQYITKAIQF